MANTPNRSLRYPLATAAPNIPQDFLNLATDVDNALAAGGAIVVTSTTRPTSPANGVLIWESDTGYTLRFNSSVGGWRYLGNRVVSASATARNALSAYAGLECFQSDTGVLYYFTGTLWTPSLGGPPILGKLMGPGSATFTPMTYDSSTHLMGFPSSTARLLGGVTSPAVGYLQLPCDGLWEIGGRGYLTGGVAGQASFTVYRHRAAVADVTVVPGDMVYKPTAGLDQPAPSFRDIVPLLAGDQIYMVYQLYTNVAMSWYMNTEAFGSVLQARYIGPLSGASAI